MFVSVSKFMKFLFAIADINTSTQEEKRQHRFLIYMGLLMSMGGFLWGSVCVVYELYLAAAIPYTYILITTLNLFYLYYSKNFLIAQYIQITISMFLPFLFQFFLGGFVSSGGNVLWSVIAVFGSFTLRHKRTSIIWMVLFVFVVILSGLTDSEAQVYDLDLPQAYSTAFFVANFILTITIIFTLYYYFVNSEEEARAELQESLIQLNLAQKQLIESEKMASLGSLVSGVAHEINTPLGIGITGISQIDHEIKNIEKNYHDQSLSEEELLQSISTLKQLTLTIRERLKDAVALVKSFKHISMDQHFEDKREFNLKEYIDTLMLSFQNQLKSKNVTFINNIDDDIDLDSYPGTYSQIISNLVLNSIKHGFDGNQFNNTITITAKLEDKLLLNYEDNGKGITDEIEKKIYDPFFTTKRGQGGSGLGMNIVYNLVVQKLGGTIKIIRVNPHGLAFQITINTSWTKDS